MISPLNTDYTDLKAERFKIMGIQRCRESKTAIRIPTICIWCVKNLILLHLYY